MSSYYIAVQRWPFPWMTRFRVVDHFWNDDETKLTLVKTTGDALSFPRMDRRAVRLYPSYREVQESKRVLAPREPVMELDSMPVPEQPIEAQEVPNGSF